MAFGNDLAVATRELFVRSLVDEVFVRTPIIEDIQARNQVKYSGGRYVERLVDTAEMDDLVQEYSANTPLTDEKKEMLDKPRFQWKLAQLPLRYNVDEYLQNITAGNQEQLYDLASYLTEKGQRATKLYLEHRIFNNGSTTVKTDTAIQFNSIVDALSHNGGSAQTYGNISRTQSSTAGVNVWWLGADPQGITGSGLTSTQTTATNLTIANLRKWINETDVANFMETPDDLMIAMCPTLYNKLRAEMESKLIYSAPPSGGKGSVTQGFAKMNLDGHTVVSVPYLQSTSTMRAWLFILNMRWFDLYIHTKRSFDVTDFEWQGKQTNGYDFWLARIMWAGNFVCWKPNSSMMLTSVS